ncbi:MAG: zf-HC2 domain-containing protein [Luteibacter sp.]
MTRPTPAGRDCARAWEAMPWILQATASREQETWLDSHMATCDNCRAEFEQQRKLARAVQLPSDVNLDPEQGLQRLFARLDVDDPQQAEPVVRQASHGWLLRSLAAAVVLQAVGLGALGLKLYSTSDVTAPTAYRTLSNDAPAAPQGAIHVVPDKTLSMSDWNALLQAQHLRIVDGPNSVGAFTVQSADAAVTAKQAAARLRGTHGIRFAEPVTGTP